MQDLFSRLPKQNYALTPYMNILRGEQKAYFMKHTDFANFNFKILIDYDKPYGLLADEENPNSALHYLKSIGEDARFGMLSIWIENLKSLIKDYEFLFLTVEGLDLIQNMKNGHFPTDESRINFTLRDTIDLRVAGLITNYNAIVYDKVREVEVLPINLRRFDMSIVLFVSGYYNMMIYDDLGHDEKELERKIFPTIRKLSDDTFNHETLSSFNNMIFNIFDCEIMRDESGKNAVSEITNESFEIIRSNLNLSYRFCNVNGNFNNNYGQANYGSFLAMISELHKDLNAPINEDGKVKDLIDSIGDRVKNKFIELTDKKTYLDAGKKLLNDTIDMGLQKLSNVEAMIFSKVTATGDLWNKLSVDYAREMVQNTVNLTVNNLEDKLVRDPLTKLNNVILNNYSSNLYEVFKSENPRKGVSLMSNPPKQTYEDIQQNGEYKPYEIGKNIEYKSYNVFKRNGL